MYSATGTALALAAEVTRIPRSQHGTTASWHTVDVTAFVQAQLAAGQDAGLAIASTATAYGPFTSFSSKEAIDNHPYLELTPS
ncbi:DNRLRE domain-containing protein [Nonomuraea angiospora]|uniref:CBM96 family carbohydrate-binding protein n=1 Tax=Nonomuraea angiospora TaxID=46172 RepID=UPI0037A707DF